ncbi:MAG: exonuclease domain-containing protein [Planctomycetota bacterium]|jgi:DNA polymerase-3 subunit epsilon
MAEPEADVKHLKLDRPLVFFDLETTGTDPARDKIVEIAVLRLEPDGERRARTRRIDPERPIPPEATAVHGIRDEDVQDAPPFRRVARSLLDLLEGADFGGFNVRRFDLPLLERELRECGLDLGLERRRVVDAMTIFHRKEPRDLSAAVQHYLGREHEDAHGAEADVNAAVDVLDAQLERYPDVPRTVEELDAWLRPRGETADEQGKFVQRGGEIVFNFGKHRGRSLEEVAREAPDYLDWIVGSDFPEDAKETVREVMAKVRGQTLNRE